MDIMLDNNISVVEKEMPDSSWDRPVSDGLGSVYTLSL